jgi:hypothetical protein
MHEYKRTALCAPGTGLEIITVAHGAVEAGRWHLGCKEREKTIEFLEIIRKRGFQDSENEIEPYHKRAQRARHKSAVNKIPPKRRPRESLYLYMQLLIFFKKRKKKKKH